MIHIDLFGVEDSRCQGLLEKATKALLTLAIEISILQTVDSHNNMSFK